MAFGGEPAPRVGDIARWHEWIATVFQHSMIVPDLSVAENVFLGSTPSAGQLAGDAQPDQRDHARLGL